MPAPLLFPDSRVATDVLTFAGRAAALQDGAIRLRARGGTLAMTTAVLAPAGLGSATPTILGMRFVPVDPELECDLTIDAGTLGLDPDRPEALRLPDSAVSAAWAGISPPRGGWESAGSIASSVLASRSQWGMSAVAHALPASPGEDVVRTVRAEIWGTVDEDLGGLARGVAFAATTLGFVRGEEQAAVRRHGIWTRVSLARGHVLVRSGFPRGLTAVRETGR